MKTEILAEDYQAYYFREKNCITLQGNLRLGTVEKYDEIIAFILHHVLATDTVISLDLTRLTTLNSSGIAALGMFIIKMKEHDKNIKIIASKYISWQTISLESFKDIHPKIEIEFMVHH